MDDPNRLNYEETMKSWVRSLIFPPEPWGIRRDPFTHTLPDYEETMKNWVRSLIFPLLEIANRGMTRRLHEETMKIWVRFAHFKIERPYSVDRMLAVMHNGFVR